MSDPVTNVDVEDVLSSIRRLVSDTNSDDRQVTIAPGTVEAVEAVPAKEMHAEVKSSDALILTSALRVNSSEGDSLPNTDHAEMAHFRHSVLDRERSKAEEDTVEPPSNHADWPSMADDDYYEDTELLESAPVIDFIRHGRKPEPETPPEVEDTHEAKVTEVSEESDTETHNELVQDWVDEETHSTDEEEGEGHAEADVVAEFFEPEDELAEVASEEIESIEKALDDEVVFASAAAASIVEEADIQSVGKAEVDLADIDESLIDEDALRDLVAEIVREELTGDLGERITRNVRKLVRREIHRALLTREFE